MIEQQYQGMNIGTNNGNSAMSPLVRFLLGLFTGAAVATPITGLVVKKICDRQKKEAVAKAAIEAENRGIQAAVEVAKDYIKQQGGSDSRAISEANRGILEAITDKVEEKVNELEKKEQQAEEPPIEVRIEHAPFTTFEGNKVSANNPYLQGEIPDPEARKAYERMMAERQSPSEDDGIDPNAINDYELKIDDEEATQESHAQYLEMLNTYKNVNGDIPPMVISREQFDNEHYLEKGYINWYEDDDVFEENNTKIDDPYYSFGFASGKDMFSPDRVVHRDDPDICHVRNLKLSTDFEITRVHGSYARLVLDGEAYYQGDTDS